MNNQLIMERVIAKCLLYLDFKLSNYYYQYLISLINNLYRVQLMWLICVVILNRIGKEYLVVLLNLIAITMKTLQAISNMTILKYKCLLYLDFKLSNYYHQYLISLINNLYRAQLMWLICVVILNRIGKEYLVVLLNLIIITIKTLQAISNMMILKYNTSHNIKPDNNTIMTIPIPIVTTNNNNNLNLLKAKNTHTTIIKVAMINRLH